jgi:hypothetical protein
VFIFVATTALLVLTIVSITGGFVIEVGLLRFSSHRVTAPLVVALLAYAAAAIKGRQSFLAAARVVPAFLEAHATSAVVILAAAAAGIGIGYGTHAVSGADASGYFNEATLLERGMLSVPTPLAARVSWPAPELSFAPLGFKPAQRASEIVPTYPPGLPIVLAIALVLASESGMFLVVPLLGALTVLGTYWLALRLARPTTYDSGRTDRADERARTAGAVAAALMATSPVFLFQIVQPMSDVPAAALWTLALVLALSSRPVGAGAISGLALLTRPSLLPLAVAVAAVLTIWSDQPKSLREWAVRLLSFGAALSAAIVVLALIQWQLYGHPLASGHGTFAELFAAGNILPNIRDYSVRLFKGEAPAIVLATASALVIAVVRRGASPSAPVMSSLRLTILVALLVLLCYLPYGVFPDWSYLRFLLPMLPLVFVTTGALVVNASARLPAVIRGPILLVAVTAACSTNVLVASREQAFNLRHYEARYRTVGRYLAAALPKEAVIVTSQESGSAHYYTGRPILRWDLLAADLDTAVDELTKRGQHPVLLVEDWEEPELRRRFPASAVAKIDWPSRARFGTTTRVRLLDPQDRGRPVDWTADRLP